MAEPAPLVSIITAVRNDTAGLSRTRDSVVSQQGVPVEWIIVDGASTDGSAQLARACRDGDPRITVISEPDQGLYDAMNKGLSRARGEFVTFLNAGDTYLQDDVLARIAAALAASGPVDLVFAGQVKRYPNGQDLEVPAHDPERWIRHSLPASHQACFMRRTLHLAHPYDFERFPVSADYQAVAAMHAAGARSLRVDVTAVFSDKSTDSVSFRHPWRVMRDSMRVQREILGLGRAAILASALRRAAPIAFWRLSRVIPGLVHVPQWLGRGRVWRDPGSPDQSP